MTGSGDCEASILVEESDGIGWLTLNRPRSINALNHEMVAAITRALTCWSTDDAVEAIVVAGAGDRGLCAGGDIRAIYDDARSGGSASLSFWRNEYRMNALIARYPKPVVPIMDGIVMGGGVGISAHASHRIVTDRSVIAMPEVNIGLVPDVGGTYLLARAPGWLGLHAALTGFPLTGADAIVLGLADHYIDHRDLPDLMSTIRVHGPTTAIYTYAAEPPPSGLAAQRDWIDSCYEADTARQIIKNLRAAGSEPATEAADAIMKASPMSVVAALHAIRSNRRTSPTIEQALNQEYNIVGAALRSPDLVEGIRAQVIDKDRTPHWSTTSIDDVTDAQLSVFFADLPDSPFPDVTTVPPQPQKVL